MLPWQNSRNYSAQWADLAEVFPVQDILTIIISYEYNNVHILLNWVLVVFF